MTDDLDALDRIARLFRHLAFEFDQMRLKRGGMPAMPAEGERPLRAVPSPVRPPRTEDLSRRWWLPERDEYIIREYPLGTLRETMRRALNAMPGRHISPSEANRIAVRASVLGVARPVQAKPPLDVAPEPVAAPEQPAASQQPVPVRTEAPPRCTIIVPATPKPPAESPPAAPKPPPEIAKPAFSMLGGAVVDPAAVRGKPGTWVPPITKPLAYIREIAPNHCFFDFKLEHLPALNKARVRDGYPPLSVKMGALATAGMKND